MTSRGETDKKQLHKQRLANLREKTARKIDYHLSKAFIDTHDFYHLITEFFLELLDKSYSATYEEIIEELENIEHDFLLFNKEQRKRVQELLTTLSELEYKQQKISQEEAKKLLVEFKSIAEDFTRFEEDSLDRALRACMHALERKDAQAARNEYQRANTLYSKLGEKEKVYYFENIQLAYAKLQKIATLGKYA